MEAIIDKYAKLMVEKCASGYSHNTLEKHRISSDGAKLTHRTCCCNYNYTTYRAPETPVIMLNYEQAKELLLLCVKYAENFIGCNINAHWICYKNDDTNVLFMSVDRYKGDLLFKYETEAFKITTKESLDSLKKTMINEFKKDSDECVTFCSHEYFINEFVTEINNMFKELSTNNYKLEPSRQILLKCLCLIYETQCFVWEQVINIAFKQIDGYEKSTALKKLEKEEYEQNLREIARLQLQKLKSNDTVPMASVVSTSTDLINQYHKANAVDTNAYTEAKIAVSKCMYLKQELKKAEQEASVLIKKCFNN